jgi:hypothetical protein
MKKGFVMGFWQAAGALTFTAIVTVAVTAFLLSVPVATPAATTKSAVKGGCGCG